MKETKSILLTVLKRELHRMVSRRLYFGVCIVLPLFTLFFMATIFGNGQMENIPVGIVDLDQTATSRSIARNVSVVPTFKVTRHFSDEAAARFATQKKDIYGYLVIPPGLEARVMDGKQATLAYYYHYALLSVGSEVHGAFETLLQTLATAPVAEQATAEGVSPSQIKSFLLPVGAQNHPLFNPDLDYSVYLTYPFFFILFQVLILLTTVYAVGSEIKFRTADEWMACARGNIFLAVTGKLIPYAVIYIILSIVAGYVYFGLLHIPFSCGFWPLNLTAALFVVATMALGVFLFSLFPALSIVISIVSMVGSLGATLSGVTFPAPFFFPAVYYASLLFPVRHFVEIMQNALYGDYGFPYTWANVAALFLFIPVALLMLPHLKRAIESHKYENIR